MMFLGRQRFQAAMMREILDVGVFTVIFFLFMGACSVVGEW